MEKPCGQINLKNLPPIRNKAALVTAITVAITEGIFSFLTADENAPPSDKIKDNGLPLSREEQAKLTPDDVLKILMEGNRRFAEGEELDYNIKKSVEAARDGQFPKAYVLSCIDSRVPVEDVFNLGLGDIFVGRVAGNIENEDQLGSMEFAAAVAGVRLVLVLGHEACGAVKGACDNVRLGNITSLLANIHPTISDIPDVAETEKNSKNKAFVERVIERNVSRTISDIRKRSEVLSNLENQGRIKIVGGVYKIETGRVTLID